jgi:hypothetical protein
MAKILPIWKIGHDVRIIRVGGAKLAEYAMNIGFKSSISTLWAFRFYRNRIFDRSFDLG